MRSVWQADAALPEHSSLQGDARADVLVIGGGLAGLLTAWELREAGVDVLLLERSRVCSATTAHTTAKITAQHGLIYGKLLNSLGPDGALEYYRANADAVDWLKGLCRRFQVPMEEKGSFVYSASRRKMERQFSGSPLPCR